MITLHRKAYETFTPEEYKRFCMVPTSSFFTDKLKLYNEDHFKHGFQIINTFDWGDSYTEEYKYWNKLCIKYQNI